MFEISDAYGTGYGLEREGGASESSPSLGPETLPPLRDSTPKPPASVSATSTLHLILLLRENAKHEVPLTIVALLEAEANGLGPSLFLDGVGEVDVGDLERDRMRSRPADACRDDRRSSQGREGGRQRERSQGDDPSPCKARPPERTPAPRSAPSDRGDPAGRGGETRRPEIVSCEEAALGLGSRQKAEHRSDPSARATGPFLPGS